MRDWQVDLTTFIVLLLVFVAGFWGGSSSQRRVESERVGCLERIIEGAPDAVPYDQCPGGRE